MFEVTIKEIIGHPDGLSNPIERYRQTVETLDMRKLIDAVNYVKRVRKPKEQKAA